jgi:hypothetical protein
MTKVEELKHQIRDLSPDELEELRRWFWEPDAIDAQWLREAVRRKQAPSLPALAQPVDAPDWLQTSQRRYRELVDGKVRGVPGPLVFQRLRARLRR